MLRHASSSKWKKQHNYMNLSLNLKTSSGNPLDWLVVKSDIWGIWLHFIHQLHDKQWRGYDSCLPIRKARSEESHGFLRPQISWPEAGHVDRDGHFPKSFPNGEQTGRNKTHTFFHILKVWTWDERKSRLLSGTVAVGAHFRHRCGVTDVQKRKLWQCIDAI